MPDFADRDGFVWMDGTLVPWRSARTHVLTHGLHYGTSVFEGIRCYGGRPFALRAHSDRLLRSARLMGFELPCDAAALDDAVSSVVAANGITDGYVRPVAFRGSEDMGLSAPGSRVHVAVAAWPWPAVFGDGAAETGIRVTVSPWRRPAPDMAPVKAKAGALYGTGALARRQAEAQGFGDALLRDHRGDLAEATGANLFVVAGGAVLTPLADGFLDGITRSTVMALARDAGFPVREVRLADAELHGADEVFLTGTAYEVQPVSAVGDRAYAVGPVTRRLMTLYRDLVRGGG